MNAERQRLDTLKAEAEQGNQVSAANLRQRIAPGVDYLVRRTLRLGQGDSPTERYILAEARRLWGSGPRRLDSGREPGTADPPAPVRQSHPCEPAVRVADSLPGRNRRRLRGPSAGPWRQV